VHSTLRLRRICLRSGITQAPQRSAAEMRGLAIESTPEGTACCVRARSSAARKCVVRSPKRARDRLARHAPAASRKLSLPLPAVETGSRAIAVARRTHRAMIVVARSELSRISGNRFEGDFEATAGRRIRSPGAEFNQPICNTRDAELARSKVRLRFRRLRISASIGDVLMVSVSRFEG